MQLLGKFIIREVFVNRLTACSKENVAQITRGGENDRLLSVPLFLVHGTMVMIAHDKFLCCQNVLWYENISYRKYCSIIITVPEIFIKIKHQSPL